MTGPSDDCPGFLFVLPWRPDGAGGVNQVVLNLWEQMERAGHLRPALMVADWDCPRALTTSGDGGLEIRVRLRPPWIPDVGLRSALRFLVSLPAAVIRMRRLLKRHRIAVVNAHYVGTSIFLFVLLRRLRWITAAVVLSFHGADIRQASRSTGADRWIWRYIVRHADARIAVSGDLSREVHAFCPEADVITIHNGLDIPKFFAERSPDDRIDSRLEHRPFVLCVATFEHWKGHDILLRAFAAMAQLVPDLCLVLIGKSGTYEREVVEAIARLSLGDRVVLIKDLPHARVLPYFESAKLFVLPSRKEPFGIVLLEAGACGLPVIATAVGGIPEIVADNVHGRLVPPDDVDALRRAVTDLLSDPVESARLGQNLRRHVAEHFAWKTAYDAYIKHTACTTPP